MVSKTYLKEIAGLLRQAKAEVENFGPDDLVAAEGEALDAALEAITSHLESGERVQLPGFGSFSIGERAARTGRNPRTGEPMTIKASTQPKFKAGKGLKDAVN